MCNIKKTICILVILCTTLFFTAGCASVLLYMLAPGGESADAEQSVLQAEQTSQTQQAASSETQVAVAPIPSPPEISQVPEAARKPETDASGVTSFDYDVWPMIAPNVFGGSIEIGVPVTGMISESTNFHRFTLVVPPDTIETFGLTLVVTADSDELFEIFFSEFYYDQPLILDWIDFYTDSSFLEIDGRTMTITYPGYDYPEGTFIWEFNCPEYQWRDGPDDENPSDLKLLFWFLLDPDAECSDPFV